MVGDRPAGTRVGQDITNCLQEIVRDYWDGSHNQLMSAGPPYGTHSKIGFQAAAQAVPASAEGS